MSKLLLPTDPPTLPNAYDRKIRRVFGRVRATVTTPDGPVTFTATQTRQGLTIRKLYSRHPAYLRWPELIALAQQQEAARTAIPPEPHPELFHMEPAAAQPQETTP